MKKIIFCAFLKCNAEKQDYQIYPGKLGKRIYDTISKQAWLKWINEQTKLINEKKLNMLYINDQKYLEKKMIQFFFKEDQIFFD